MNPSVASISSQLARLREAKAKAFGSEEHQFVLNPPLSESDVSVFEAQHKIKLPADYRDFLLHAGNGGAGPVYGVFPLGQMDDNFDLRQWHEGDGMIGKLSAPFPFTEAWNDLSGQPSDDLCDEDEDAYDAAQELFESRYWGPLDGVLPICHEGCAIRIWLVVTGPQAGRLWRDTRCDYLGLAPMHLADGSPATFSGWYGEWLAALTLTG